MTKEPNYDAVPFEGGGERRRAPQEKLERKGWKVGSAADFLGLSPAEEALVAVKMGLVDALRQRRRKSEPTRVELAKRIGSNQSRVAKMEAGDPSVSIELVIRALLAIGPRPLSAVCPRILVQFWWRKPQHPTRPTRSRPTKS